MRTLEGNIIGNMLMILNTLTISIKVIIILNLVNLIYCSYINWRCRCWKIKLSPKVINNNVEINECRYVKGAYDNVSSTIGVEFAYKVATLKNKTKVKA